jgi:hypothetical protein
MSEPELVVVAVTRTRFTRTRFNGVNMMELWSVDNADSSSPSSNRVRSKGFSPFQASSWSYCSAKVTLRSLRSLGRFKAEVDTAATVAIFVFLLVFVFPFVFVFTFGLAMEGPAINFSINGS